MSDFQQITVTGRLTRDPEMSYTPNGQAVTRLSVATGRWNSSKKQEETSFYNVSAWGKQGETINQWGKKGTLLLVVGQPNVRQYVRKDGTGGVSLDIEFATVTMLGGFKSKQEVAKEEMDNSDPLGDIEEHVF